MPTRASDIKPTRRAVSGERPRGPRGVPPELAVFVLEVCERTLRLRPKGTRSGGPAEVEVTFTALYDHLLMARARREAAERRSRRRRA